MSLGKRLDEAGWRQGSIVNVEDHATIAKELPDGARIIVISQSCDIIQPSDEAEPYVDVIVATPIDAEDGNFTYNKNPRKLHITLNTGNGDKYFQLLQIDKITTERTKLDGLIPEDGVALENSTVNVIARWLAARYLRPAFPNEFNDLINGVRKVKKKKVEKKERKAAKKISPVVSGIFLQVIPFRDLEDGESYSVNMIALVPASNKAADLTSPEIRDPVAEIAAVMTEAGMDVSWVIRFEDKVPYSYFRDDFIVWSYEDISLANDPTDDTPLE